MVELYYGEEPEFIEYETEETNDLDIKVYCPCGEIFYIYVPNVMHKCSCGRIYKSVAVTYMGLGNE